VSNPYAEGPDEPRQVRGWAVAVGIVIGLVGTIAWMFVIFIVALSMENSPDSLPDWLIFALFILPLPASILLLCFRRTRQAAAGIVMGLAIGSLVVAGLCSSFIVPGLVA
jgi:hypothetical protein